MVVRTAMLELCRGCPHFEELDLPMASRALFSRDAEVKCKICPWRIIQVLRHTEVPDLSGSQRGSSMPGSGASPETGDVHATSRMSCTTTLRCIALYSRCSLRPGSAIACCSQTHVRQRYRRISLVTHVQHKKVHL